MASRARPFRERRRESKNLRPKEVVLIVCEGAKTEPRYFQSLRSHLKLSTASIVVFGEECGSSPTSVVDYALQQFKKNRIYDRIYCVFDRDAHPKFQAAVERCNAQKLTNEDGKKVVVEAVTSDPCFEYWLLLHFEDTDAPFASEGRLSVGGVAERRLRRHLADYKKGAADTLAQTLPSIVLAMGRAERIGRNGFGKPHTKVFRLVAVLASLAEESAGDWIPAAVLIGQQSGAVK